MAKVYVVSGHENWEGSDVLGVALSEAEAQKVIDTHLAEEKDKGGVRYSRTKWYCHHDVHDWEEFELDIPVPEGFTLVTTKHGVHWRKLPTKEA